MNSVTTTFVGEYYEATGTVKKNYYAGAQMVAYRDNGTLRFVFGDHLGSSTVTADVNGGNITRQLFKAWGETRSSASLGMKYTYTGQYSYSSDFGLQFYRSRWYDSSLGRWAQPDTIVPLASQGVQGLDRFAYVNNAPTRWTDSSGHGVDCGIGEKCRIEEKKKVPPPPPPDEPTSSAMLGICISPTKYPNYDKKESAKEARQLVARWITGLGQTPTVFTEDDSLGMDVLASSGMQEFFDVWEENGFPVPFAWEHTVDDRRAGMSKENQKIFFISHFQNNVLTQLGLGSDYAEGPVDSVNGVIGSLDVIYVAQYDKDNVVIAVHNTMGMASFTRKFGTNDSFLPNHSRSDFGPGGSTFQIFYFILPNP